MIMVGNLKMTPDAVAWLRRNNAFPMIAQATTRFEKFVSDFSRDNPRPLLRWGHDSPDGVRATISVPEWSIQESCLLTWAQIESEPSINASLSGLWSTVLGKRIRQIQDARPVLNSDQKCSGQEYSSEEVEFLRAIQRFQKEHHRPFPTFVEVLRVAESLGYRKETVKGK